MKHEGPPTGDADDKKSITYDSGGRVKKARLIGSDVGTGLSRYLRLLEQMLSAAHFRCSSTPPAPWRRGDGLLARAAAAGLRAPSFDLQLFTQDLSPRLLPFSKRNLLLPMQEWFAPRDVPLLRGFDTIICQSSHALEIFAPLHHDVRCLPFTSVDRFQPVAAAERNRILHIAGRSPYKGTAQLVRIWQRHPEWPLLTVTHAEGVLPPLGARNIEQHIGHLPDAQIQRFQNEAWLHIQTSEAEGFGHCLFEAMSCGGVVLTVDAPPMNELISAERGEGVLVPHAGSTPLNMGFRFLADEEALESSLADLLMRGREGTMHIGDAARRRFLEQDARVRQSYCALFLEA